MSAGRRANSFSKDWCTPKKYVDAVKRMFDGKIDLDPCSNADSIVGARKEYRLPEQDGLREPWTEARIYVNPPYGADRERGTTIKNWLKKIAQTYLAAPQEREILALIPVATNTRHWKEYVFGVADAVCFLHDTRLKFIIGGNEDNKGAPMACCMVYWGKKTTKFEKIFSSTGAVVLLENQKKASAVECPFPGRSDAELFQTKFY